MLDKPAGITSQTAVTRVKILYNAAKAGHTGTLDPLATGLLPVCLGDATKFAHDLLGADKRYHATVRFGIRTATGDLEGEVLETRECSFVRSDLEAVLARFAGPILQTPPMYSALKRNGRPLYDYARRGETVERIPREVTIHAIRLLAFTGTEAEIDVTCSKGTYIRVLAEDIGAALGCGGTLSALRRTAVGEHSLNDAMTLEELEAMEPAVRDARLAPCDVLVRNLPEAHVDEQDQERFLHGQSIPDGGKTGEFAGLVRVYGPGAAFLGLGEAGGGRIAPRKLLAIPSS